MSRSRTEYDKAAAASNARLAEKLARAAREDEFQAWASRRRQRQQGRRAGLAAAAAATGSTVEQVEAGVDRLRARLRYERESREVFGR